MATMYYLPEHMPAATTLSTATYSLLQWRKVKGVKRVLFLNLMPLKSITELDIARTLCASDIPYQLIPVKFRGMTYKNTPREHMDACYLDFEDLIADSFDRLIITGAPVEQMPFEEVRYWADLCRLMDWADAHVARILYVCWGSQAGLYHHYGIQKHPLSHKCFGIFSQKVVAGQSPLMEGMATEFPMPHSRHTEVRWDEITAAAPHLQLIAHGAESGVGIVATPDVRRTYIVGHLEYEPYTLHNEYHRDLSKQLPISKPEHYYAPDGSVPFVWQQAAITFYRNWLR